MLIFFEETTLNHMNVKKRNHLMPASQRVPNCTNLPFSWIHLKHCLFLYFITEASNLWNLVLNYDRWLELHRLDYYSRWEQQKFPNSWSNLCIFCMSQRTLKPLFWAIQEWIFFHYTSLGSVFNIKHIPYSYTRCYFLVFALFIGSIKYDNYSLCVNVFKCNLKLFEIHLNI